MVYDLAERKSNAKTFEGQLYGTQQYASIDQNEDVRILDL